MKETTADMRNTVIYQIFTRNYSDGTFRAVLKDLPRIQALGVDYIYLLPIHPSGVKNRKGSVGSPYAISDYRAIDPAQGSLESFIELSGAIHDAGMKLMIDVVYNHTSPDSWLAQNHPEWFYHKADGSLGNRCGDWWDVVDLDYSNMDLWDYQIETLKYWAQYVDGYRCDVAPMIPLEFWMKARSEVAKVNPDCIWLAESVEPEFISYNRANGVPTLSDGELYQAFDILYDYDIYKYMVGAIRGTNSLKEYLDKLNLQEMIYPANYCKLRCLENHDRMRAAALIPDSLSLSNWTAFNYFAKGPAMIYAGQEYCVEHHPTLFDRDPVVMETGKDISWLMNILAGIKQELIFAYGNFEAHTTGFNDEVIYASYEGGVGTPAEGNRAIGIFSTTARKQSLSIDLPDGRYTNLINDKLIDVFEGAFAYDGDPLIVLV